MSSQRRVEPQQRSVPRRPPRRTATRPVECPRPALPCCRPSRRLSHKAVSGKVLRARGGGRQSRGAASALKPRVTSDGTARHFRSPPLERIQWPRRGFMRQPPRGAVARPRPRERGTRDSRFAVKLLCARRQRSDLLRRGGSTGKQRDRAARIRVQAPFCGALLRRPAAVRPARMYSQATAGLLQSVATGR